MKRTEQILEAIDELTKQKGFPPSVREIGERVGLKSSSTTKGPLDRLRKKGLVDWEEEDKPRTLHLLRKETATI
ncbi:transcriptional regulator [Bacillus swezeyi]|uniref:Transcriptional regulator n=1 Tax=Bacillus swezeyi TaxID=1925020 RepID=A0A1R1Q954_9BACI|nr:transcriptional regulator [Bacillus swezeyi]MEC1259508.1 transcriptional regulator [Bacillus swezeyi]MED2927530.1 transcriptional regulator [Bacillus swezeyi]MED2941786.1 transcriptional regulator [Bacillus swezeyi]MED2962728.1 transcriptional regulator [Bacillus swezeyi]MED2977336.1 transcriptional regulator [Bacillus swezeyi]